MVSKSMNLTAFLAFASILFGVPQGQLTEKDHGVSCSYFRDAWDHAIPLNICHGQYGGAVESSTSYKFVCSPDKEKVLRYAYIGIDCSGPVIDSQPQIDHGFQCDGSPCPYYERFECSGAGCETMEKNYGCECPTWSTKYYTMNDFNDVNCIGDDKPDDQCTNGNFVKNTCHNELTFNYDCYPSTTEYPTKKPSIWYTTGKPTPKPTNYWTTSKPTKEYPTPKPTRKTTTKYPTPKPTWKTTTPKPTTKYPTGYPTRKPTWKTQSPTKKPTKSYPTPKPTWKTTTKKPTWKTTKKPTRYNGIGSGIGQ